MAHTGPLAAHTAEDLEAPADILTTGVHLHGYDCV